MKKIKFLKPIVFLAIIAGFSIIVMLSWNWLTPIISGLSIVNFWQALAILTLCLVIVRLIWSDMMKLGVETVEIPSGENR